MVLGVLQIGGSNLTLAVTLNVFPSMVLIRTIINEL